MSTCKVDCVHILDSCRPIIFTFVFSCKIATANQYLILPPKNNGLVTIFFLVMSMEAYLSNNIRGLEVCNKQNLKKIACTKFPSNYVGLWITSVYATRAVKIREFCCGKTVGSWLRLIWLRYGIRG